MQDNKNAIQNRFIFNGKGSDYFGLWIINSFLTVITLGLYYPWAKAAKLKYFYSNTTLDGHSFTFNGTGNEMFWGFVKALGFFVVLGFVAFTFQGVGLFIFYGVLFLLAPFAIHSSMRYRLSRTSYKNVNFGYTGDLQELVLKYYGNVLLTVLTAGIYGSWMQVSIREYMLKNTWYGDAQFYYRGKGGNLFWIKVQGFFFTIFTFGIYLPWYVKNLYKFYIDNVSLHHEGHEYQAFSDLDGGNLFGNMIINYFQTIFTLGLGIPWIEVRNMNTFVGSVTISGDLEDLTVKQTQEQYNDAMGEDMNDLLDIGII